jgi:hypothetical protein
MSQAGTLIESGRFRAMASHETISNASVAPLPLQETHGEEILKWGALVALVIETIFVLGGITAAIILH